MITVVISFVTGLLVGIGLAWIISAAIAKSQVAAAEARVEELRQQIKSAGEGFDGLRRKLEQSEAARIEAETKVAEIQTLTDVFNSLASTALQSNNSSFLQLAEQKFNLLKEGAKSDLETRKEAIKNLVEPLAKAITDYQQQTKELEDKRNKELGSVGESLSSLAKATTTLQSETAKLVNALRSPQIRGRWGEIALRKTAELAGMSTHCDFIEQESVDIEGGRLRPDMVVKLPAGREVVVDSKVSLIGFMEALEAKTDEEREAALVRHAAHVNKHILKLSAKEYWDQFPSSPEFVVLFIPNDSFLAAAAEKDPNLIEFALTKKVVIATPTTFIALLRAIAYGWRQEQLTENAERISILGQEISDRIATIVEYFNEVGESLRGAVDSYNKAATSFETRLLASARKFKEMGSSGKKDIEELQSIDQTPRRLKILDKK